MEAARVSATRTLVHYTAAGSYKPDESAKHIERDITSQDVGELADAVILHCCPIGVFWKRRLRRDAIHAVWPCRIFSSRRS